MTILEFITGLRKGQCQLVSSFLKFFSKLFLHPTFKSDVEMVIVPRSVPNVTKGSPNLKPEAALNSHWRYLAKVQPPADECSVRMPFCGMRCIVAVITSKLFLVLVSGKVLLDFGEIRLSSCINRTFSASPSLSDSCYVFLLHWSVGDEC